MRGAGRPTVAGQHTTAVRLPRVTSRVGGGAVVAMGYLPDTGVVDIQRSRQAWHRRQSLIERFTEDQRRKRNWINFAEIAEWCSDLSGSIAPNDKVRADAYRKLQQAMLDGDFEQNGLPGVRLLHPKMFKRIQREYLRIISATHGERFRSDVLPYCWVSRGLFERWCAKHHLPASPRFQPREDNVLSSGTELSKLNAETYRSGLPGKPTSRNLIKDEYLARIRRGETENTITLQAKVLASWLKQNHPKAPSATPKTIANVIRQEFRSHTNNARK